MWLCFNDGFISAVADKDNKNLIWVRARRREILENLFPEYEIIELESSDYAYRICCTKPDLDCVVSQRIYEIDYNNFKNSVVDEDLHRLYNNFWFLHYNYQR